METLSTILALIGAALIGYLFGSIPSGVIIGKMHGIDIRNYGSHNPGGTNVGRTLGKGAGILTMVLDALKCILPMLITLLILVFTPISQSFIDYKYLNETFLSVIAFFVFIGHTFPLFAHFQGGKAVAAFAGYMLFVSPILFAIGCVIFFTLFKLKHRVSISSIVAVPSVFLFSLVPMILDFTILPLPTDFNGGLYFGSSFMLHISFTTVIVIFLTAALIVFRHKSNIKRIREGKEPETHFQNTIDSK